MKRVFTFRGWAIFRNKILKNHLCKVPIKKIEIILTGLSQIKYPRCSFLHSEKVQNAGDLCESPPAAPCDPDSVYYTLDGSCNNLEIPSWGQAGKPFTRIVKANYSDGNSKR